jgi:hypothetical protein
VKSVFGLEKTGHPGLRNSHRRLYLNFALTDLYLHRKRPAPARIVCPKTRKYTQ